MEKNEPTQSKYDAALAKYNTQLDDAEIAAQVARIIAEKVPANNTPEVKKFLFNCIDLTTLKSEDSDESVMKFTQKVNKFDEEFPDLKNVAAICVYPNFAEVVKDTLEVEDVKIACVSAGFPSSQTFIEVKVAETAMALMEGADEIDIVISVGKFLAGDYESMDAFLMFEAVFKAPVSRITFMWCSLQVALQEDSQPAHFRRRKRRDEQIHS